MFGDLIRTARLHDQNGRYILADILEKFILKLSAKKFDVEPMQGFWIAHVDFANKQYAKDAGFQWKKWNPANPNYGCWGTNKPAVIQKLDKNVWNVISSGDKTLKTIIKSEDTDLNVDVTYDNVKYYVAGQGIWGIKDRLKNLGFKFDPTKSSWTTFDKEAAESLRSSKDFDIYRDSMMNYDRDRYKASYQATPESQYNLIQPANGKIKYYPYQEVAIYTGIKDLRSGHGIILGDPTGLGKTGEAIGIINNMPDVKTVLIVSTSKTKRQWQKELHNWLSREFTIGIAEKQIWPSDQIVICSWDTLHNFKQYTDKIVFDMIILDEAHKMNNSASRRSKSVIGELSTNSFQYEGGLKGKYKIELTATPIGGKPNKLWPLLHFIDPKEFPTFKPFKNKYGIYKDLKPVDKSEEEELEGDENPKDPKKEEKKSRGGEIYMGPQNLDELNKVLRSKYMIRRNKEEVAKDLPPKTRRIIELELSHELPKNVEATLDQLGITQSLDNLSKLKKDMDEKSRLYKLAQTHPTKEILNKITTLVESEKQYVAQLERLHTTMEKSFEKLAELRRIDGIHKAPLVGEYINDLLEESPNKKLTVFAHHQDVILMIKNVVESENPGSVLLLTGGMSDSQSFKIVQEFQTNPDKKVFLGSLEAVKEGLDGLQKVCSHLIFAEQSYNPDTMEQGEGRLYRNLQGEPVLVDYIVKHNSLDAHAAQINAMKIKNTVAVLDPITPGQTEEVLTSTGTSQEKEKAIMDAIVMVSQKQNGEGFAPGKEAGFGDSLAKQVLDRGFLTPKQMWAGVSL